MDKKRLFIFLLIFIPVLFYGSYTELTNRLVNLTESGRIDQIDKELKRRNFRDENTVKALFETGMDFYHKGYKNKAYELFLKGYYQFGDDEYKSINGLMLSRILYQKNNREAALYYINRVIQLIENDENQLVSGDEAWKMKRRIRWDYLSRYEGLPDNSISRICFDGDDVWIGMWTGGLIRYSRSSGEYEFFGYQLLSPHIRDILVSNGEVLVGTYNGLYRYNKKKSEWSKEKGIVGRLTVKRIKSIDGDLYIATLGGGLYRYLPETKQWRPFFDGAENVTDFFKSGSDFYIATLEKGLFRRGQDGSTKNIVRDVSVKMILSDNNKIYLATYGKGLIIVNKKSGEIIDILNRKRGLPSDFIESLLLTEQQLIIGTLGGGIVFWNQEEEKMQVLNILDGLPSNDVVEMIRQDQRLWIGTLSGGVGILLTEDFEDIFR